MMLGHLQREEGEERGVEDKEGGWGHRGEGEGHGGGLGTGRRVLTSGSPALYSGLCLSRSLAALQVPLLPVSQTSVHPPSRV